MAHGDAGGEVRRSGNETHASTSQYPVTLCHAIPGANPAFPSTLSSLLRSLLAGLAPSVDSFSSEAEVRWKCLQERSMSSAGSAWLAPV